MTTDRLSKIDPKTGQDIEYLMPRDTNMRRVFADDSTTPATIWTGSNHGAAIVKDRAARLKALRLAQFKILGAAPLDLRVRFFFGGRDPRAQPHID